MKFLKVSFYLSNLALIILYLYPGSLIGCLFYNDCQIEPKITKDFLIVSSNHLYLFFALSVHGFISFPNQNKKIFYYLILISIFLELMHLLIPIRAFQIQDLLGNIFGVVISYFIFKILNTRKKKE